MAGLTPYLHFPGSTRAALAFYRSVFGGDVEVHTYADFGRTDGDGELIAHGELRGPVALFAADAGPDDTAMVLRGVSFSLLGTAEPARMTAWFEALSVGGRVVDPLQRRPWGDHGGTVVDRFGVPWLIGFSGEPADPTASSFLD